MTIVYIFETQYICRLVPGGWILNPYTPVEFQS